MKFGTDGIRGIYPEEINEEIAALLAEAVEEFYEVPKGEIWVIGDTRSSTPFLVRAIGGKFAGILPTAAAQVLDGVSVVVSASHNPSVYNGLKVLRYGEKIPVEDERELEKIMSSMRTELSEQDLKELVRSREKRHHDFGRGKKDEYVEFLLNRTSPYKIFEGKVVVDVACGAAVTVAPSFFRMRGMEDSVKFVAKMGEINAGCGATHPGFVKKKMKEVGARVGIAFDGDADRMVGWVDDEFVDGTALLVAAALEYGYKKVAVSILTNWGAVERLREAGVEVIVTPVGDRWLATEVKEGAAAGSEPSGHVVFEGFKTGDGLVSATVFLDLVARGVDFSALYKPYAQAVENIGVRSKDFVNYEDYKKVVEKYREFEGGRSVIRPSGTEPVLRVMVEAVNEDLAYKMLKEIIEELRKLIGNEFI